MQRESRKLLWDIRDALDRIARYRMGRTFADYQTDEMFQGSVERRLAVIGEGVSQLTKIDPDLAAQIPDKSQIISFRNILIHAYAEIKPELIWDVLDNDLPVLAAIVDSLIRSD
ncbi:MAG: DUF86 domain-containing protein [Chloroflexota bacterium]